RVSTFCQIPRPLRSPLFPYTTLFRSGGATPRPELWTVDELVGQALDGLPGSERVDVELDDDLPTVEIDAAQLQRVLANLLENARSEEHTSELQSPDHLVCRLLLEKKT